MGDGWGVKNKVLRNLIKEKAAEAIVGFLAKFGGTAIGKKMPNGLVRLGGGFFLAENSIVVATSHSVGRNDA